ncbi:MAG: metallophosphoesterase [Nocardioides sp.]
MSNELAFIGDVHGNLRALEGLWSALTACGSPHAILLGDYINKGAQSADVLRTLVAFSQAGRATLLAGNHETALIDAVDREDLSAFLKMGGAMTIRSYVRGRVGPDVLRDFKANLPREHLQALRRMPLTYETAHLVAQHRPARQSSRKFRISAHVPVGDLPRIRKGSAQLDTGCGNASGRLTALLWPSLDYIQVDAEGMLVRR